MNEYRNESGNDLDNNDFQQARAIGNLGIGMPL